MIDNEGLQLIIDTTERGERIKYVDPQFVTEICTELLRRREADRWIRGSERLPDLNIPVLAMVTNAKYPQIMTLEKSYKNSLTWANRTLNGFVGYIDELKVTNYRPLPEPPEVPE